MKELSIEEKAKRYDEAIKIAKEINNEQCAQPFNVMTRVFPELKESEDEEIRKEITTYLKSVIANKGYGDSIMESWIAWLGKRSEQEAYTLEQAANIFLDALSNSPYNNKPITDAQTITKQLLNFLQNSVSYNPDALIINEQKPAEWEPQTGDTFRKKGTTSPTYHLCNKREDGITFGFVENREVGISGGEITIFALKSDYELVERPRSIEDVVEEELNKGLQTKVGQSIVWSEEDIRLLDNCISLIEDIDCTKEEQNWLKSLKSRSQLSEEQIKKDLDKAANEWECKACFSPIAMVMDGDRPVGTKQHITSHADSFKTGVNWVIKKLKGENV